MTPVSRLFPSRRERLQLVSDLEWLRKDRDRLAAQVECQKANVAFAMAKAEELRERLRAMGVEE